MRSHFSAISLFLKGHATIIREMWWNLLFISHVTAEIVIDQYSLHFLIQKKHLLLFENIDFITGTICRDLRVMKTITLKTLRCSFKFELDWKSQHNFGGVVVCCSLIQSDNTNTTKEFIKTPLGEIAEKKTRNCRKINSPLPI